MIGATALEEFGSTKGRGQGKSIGRSDLYIGFKNFEVEFEGKRKFMRADCKEENLRNLVKKNINLAVNDAKGTT